MIIDAHAHLVAPDTLYAYRSLLLATGGSHGKRPPTISDDALAECVARNIASMDEVGTDVQLLSPRPYQQGHSMRPPLVVDWWIEANNDLIARTVATRPDRFAGVMGLPLAGGEPVERTFTEIDRCVELGFVGVSLNPDPWEGLGNRPPLGDPCWYPLYEKLVDNRLPALVHSAGCCNGRETYAEHFITEESIATLSLIRHGVLDRFPDLQVIVSHGGGSVPYQIGRWQAARHLPSQGGGPDAVPFEDSLRQIWFDTVLHHPVSLELLFRIVGPDRCLFGTERPGSGTARRPAEGRWYDDIRPAIESIDFLTDADRLAIFEGNARTVFSRLQLAVSAA